MKYKKYPSYKDSGVDWLGKTPEHWNVKPAQFIATITRGAILRPVDAPEYFEENGEWAYLNISDATKCEKNLYDAKLKLSKLGSTKSARVYPNNVIITASATIGKAFINRIKVCVHDGFIPFTNIKLSNDYLYNYLSNPYLYAAMGKSNTQKNIYLDEVKRMSVTVPPKNEQQQIVTFIDNATKKMDTLIKKQENLVKLLKEKRQAVISHSVTQGLNPGVKLNDSGIEWLGKVPAHWKMSKLKYDSYIKARVGWHGLTSDELFNEGDAFAVTGSDFFNNQVNWEKCRKCTLERYEQDRFIQLKDDDLLVTKDGTIGKIIKVDKLPGIATLNGGIFVLRPLKEKYLTSYYYWILISEIFNGYISYFKTGSTISHLYQDTFNQMPYPLPPIKEQKQIADYLDKKISNIDKLIDKSNKSIELLKEKRKALISAAVTGKIDVRELV